MSSSLPKLDLGFKLFFSLSACSRSLGSTIHGKIWIKISQRKKNNWFRPGLNRGPSACKADVITTTLRNPSRIWRENNIYLNNLSWKQWRHRNKGHLLWSLFHVLSRAKRRSIWLVFDVYWLIGKQHKVFLTLLKLKKSGIKTYRTFDHSNLFEPSEWKG